MTREIENLIYRYAELIDAGDFAAVAELFSAACIVAPDDSQICGQADILRMYQRSTRLYPATGTPCTQHVTSNVLIELAENGQRAQARSRFTVFQSLPDFPLQAIIAGRYHDQFACHHGSWRFEQRVMLPDLLGDLSRHLLIDIGSEQ